MRIVMSVLFVLGASLVHAQPYTSVLYTTEHALVWSAPSNAMDIADAQQAVYKLYVDGKPHGDLSGYVCRTPEPGDTVATCSLRLTDTLVTIVNRRKVSLALTVRDPEPDSPESGPGAALVLKRRFVVVTAPEVGL